MVIEGNCVKAMLMKGFMQLMSEKPYLDITVTDIVKKSGVARASYYRNFSSIDDIANAIVDDIIEDFNTSIVPLLKYGSDLQKQRTFLRCYFERMLVRQDWQTFIFSTNIPFLFSKIENRFGELETQTSDDTIDEKYRIPCMLGMVNSVAKKWMATGAKETPDEMAEYLLAYYAK